MSRVVVAAALSLGLFLLPAVAGDYKLPRQAPEFVINYPGGKQDLLSRYKGKVVVLSFIMTTCPHCQAECKMLSKLYKELGPQGFQPIAVASNQMAIMLVNDFIKEYGVTFPVGATEQAPVLGFMKINENERWVVPQVAVIDRKGMIRVQSPFNGDEKLQDEAHLRAVITDLLKEGTPAAKKTSVSAKK